ncbi:50S rRNA methyltransferase [Candidatus Woesearchaeota archaeon CG10_big_fil_rev_8_21_14_0_10_45_16]|nr:MAG: 50S rRNA methyltransferase [Candidatus Woesearchaeota archaeon CG10_big_fil_rev_8_21_14_0_10_45_16]
MITLLAVGKARQTFVKEGIDEYLKRVQKYLKVEYKEVSTLDKVKGFVIALDEKGRQYSSEEFALFFKKIDLEQKDITFVIGEAEGLPKEFVKRCHAIISLSKMTFPTQLVRVLFMEQLYRALTIIHNEPYHKS